MQITCALVKLVAAGSIVGSLSGRAHIGDSIALTGRRQSMPVRRNTDYRPNGPLSRARACLKFGKTVPANLVAVLGKVERRTTGSVQSTPANFDSEYLAPVLIGSPPQQLNLNFDTGSSDLWVFSSYIPAGEVSGQTIYNASRSSTATEMPNATWKVTYGDGSSSRGVVYTDTVTVGGLSVPAQAVEVAQKVSQSFTSDSDTDGLLGLAFKTINMVRPVPQNTFFDNAKRTLLAPLFTVDLKHNANGTYNFGFVDHSLFTGQIAYTPVDNSLGYWGFTASRFVVGSTVITTAVSAIVDTATTLLLLPDFVVAEYYLNVRGAKDNYDVGGYTFPCNATLPDFSFSVGNNTIIVPGIFMNYAPINAAGTVCYGGIQSDSSIGFSIFGDIALKAAFVVFDGGNLRLGFASKSLSSCTA